MSTKKKPQNELKKVEDVVIYKPTPTMEKWVETAVMLGTDNVAEICRNAEVTESAYYQWKKNPKFITWMNEYSNYLIRGDGWKLNNIGMRKAKQDHRYWESMQKIVGNIKDSGSNVNVQNNWTVRIEDYPKGN